jgi:hypothetical protein
MQKIKLFMTAAFLMLAASVSAQTTYTWVEEGKSFTDGTLLYTLGSYKQTYSREVTLGDREVAVSLYLQATTDASVVIKDSIWDGKPKVEGGSFSGSGGRGITYRDLDWEYNEDVDVTGESGRQRHYYERTINCSRNGIKINTAETVNIPTTVSFNNKEYDVVAIPYAGFCFPDVCTSFVREVCGKMTSTGRDRQFWECMQGHNPFLKNVNFRSDSKLRDIGAYAFVGCVYLRSITIPKGVVTLGTASFEFCKSMQTVSFQTKEDGLSSDLNEVKPYTFYGDYSLKSIHFPEGLVTIGSYALIYLFQLTDITLPNTLVNIGAHFLCDASSMETLTIPANVTNINGAFLHGCESLKTVYMLGYPENLDEETAGEDGKVFDQNYSFCKEAVHDCTFYVPGSYLESFQKNNVWRLIDDNGSYNTVRDKTNQTHQGHGNYLKKMPVTRPFEAKTWTTAIFPKGVTNYKSESEFGPDSRFATYESCEYVGDVLDNGKLIRMYKLHFRIIESDDIPDGVVGMFYPHYAKTNYELWTSDDETDDFIASTTQPHAVGHTAGDGAYIFMSGYYVPHKLAEWDFYLSTTTKKFMRVRAGKEPTAALCRCFWTVNMDGFRVPVAIGAKDGFFDDEPTDIGTMTIAVEEPTEVYDLSGRRVNASLESLKSGIYVVNGKKVVIK